MRISNKRNLPQWFSLKKYDALHAMNDCELMHQVIYRYFDLLDGRDKNGGYFDNAIKIFPCTYNDKSNLDDEEECFTVNRKIADDAAVKPLSVMDVLLMRDYLEDSACSATRNDGIGYMVGVHEKYENMHFNVIKLAENQGMVHCELNLNCDDDVIIRSLSRLLPLWRLQLGIEMDTEESKIKTSWSINRQKMISYKIFAFHDLIRWQIVTGNKITNSVMAAALYPNGEFGETAINQTIRKYVENVFEQNYIRTLIGELHKRSADFSF